VIDGVKKPQGTWNSANAPAHITGKGSLNVTSGP
jgi:hypothetical protein